MQKYDKGEIAEIILKTLLAVGVIAFAAAVPNAVQIFKYFNPADWKERARIKGAMTRLEQSGYIAMKKGSNDLYILTKKGEEKAKRYALEDLKIIPQKTWDKKWRLVMFDIPEGKKQARRAINFALKKIGFAQYQKSVFITPFPCKEEIDFVGECFGVRDNIRIIVASEVEKSAALMKTFGV